MPIIHDNGKYYMDEGYAINHVRNGVPIAEHTHDFIEFTYVYRGRCIHTIDGIDYAASDGELFLINYNSVHEIKGESDFEYADILIKPEFVDESMKGKENAFSLLALNDFTEFQSAAGANKPFVRFFGKERNQIEELIELSEAEVKSKRSGSGLILKSCMNIFLINVFRKMALPMSNEFKMDDELLEFIRKNCGFHLQLEQLAAKCNYNPAYFSRLFKKYTGKTFTRYLADSRLDYAFELLKNTNMQIDDVIAKCGMTDRSKFFKTFADKFGATPKKLRKK